MPVRDYYRLTKPGIIYGNLLTALAGYLLASRWHIQVWHALALLSGTSLVIGGACVYNNCLDRNIDRRMKRTKQRALVTGAISLPAALTYATILTILGFGLLVVGVNHVVVIIGIIGFIDYVVAYAIAKRHSPLGTVVGSISGSMPIVAGYCAVGNRFTLTAGLLFAIMTIWQLPHFYAIALYRRQDYADAQVPVLTTRRRADTVKTRILFYILGFGATCILLSMYGPTGYLFAAVMMALTLGWFWRGFKSFHHLEPAAWGKRVFGYSLLVVTGLSVALSVGALVP